MPTRLRVFVTHPVQYHVPLWRALARSPDIDLKVYYFNDQSVRGGVDAGFGLPIAWDVDLQSGYAHEYISRTSSLQRPNAMGIPDVDDLLRRDKPDWTLVAGYMHKFERQLMRAARARGSRLLMRGEFSDLSERPRSPVKRLVRSSYLRLVYSRVDRFCYPGEFAKRHLRRFGVRDDRLFFSPYAVDDRYLEHQADQVNRQEVRRELHVPDDCFLFMLSGKLIARKDPMAVISAIERLQARERVGLVAVGDGELRGEFERRARAVLGDRFFFPGFVNQSQLSRYYGASDALVMPSRFETWGLVVNEAMHHNLPAIVSDRVECHADLIEQGVTGYTYPCGDNEALSRHMQALASAPERAAAMGHAARARVAEYTVERAASGILAAIES